MANTRVTKGGFGSVVMIGLRRRFLGSVANKEVRRSGAGSRGSGRERTKRWARLHGGEHGARIAWKYTACQFIFGVSFERGCKTLKREDLSDKVGTFGRLGRLAQDDQARCMVSYKFEG